MADNKVNSGLLEFSEDQKVFVALDAETSEVKKAVTIDGDGVETDIQGVQPSGKKEITTTAEVNVANYATAQVVDEDLVAGNIKKDVDILGVVGSYEPAAPASDFSTAEVQFASDSISVTELHFVNGGIAIIDANDEMIVQEEGVDVGTYDIVLYKNTARFWTMYEPTVTSGSASVVADDRDYLVTITGDCVITIPDNPK